MKKMLPVIRFSKAKGVAHNDDRSWHNGGDIELHLYARSLQKAAKKLVKHCYERGVIVMTAGSYGNVLRLLMPLVIEEAQLQEGLDVIESGLKEIK